MWNVYTCNRFSFSISECLQIFLFQSFYKKADSETQKTERETVSKRGRGRGRGAARPKLIKEPECLTISSDEEDDNRKKRLGESRDTCSNLLNSMYSEESDTILDKEPIITNNISIPSSVSHGLNSQNPTSLYQQNIIE